MDRPDPGSAGPEQGDKYQPPAKELAEDDNIRVCTWVEEESFAGLSFSTEGGQHKGEEVGVGREHILKVKEGCG